LAIKTTVHFQHVSSQSQLQNSITATQVFPFFAANFPQPALQKIYIFKTYNLHFFSFFAADFPATSPPKNISFFFKKTYIFIGVDIWGGLLGPDFVAVNLLCPTPITTFSMPRPKKITTKVQPQPG